MTVTMTGRFVKIYGFFVDNTCQALLSDQKGSFGMKAVFGKLFIKRPQKKLRNHKIYIKKQKYCDFIIFLFSANLTLWTQHAN